SLKGDCGDTLPRRGRQRRDTVQPNVPLETDHRTERCEKAELLDGKVDVGREALIRPDKSSRSGQGSGNISQHPLQPSNDRSWLKPARRESDGIEDERGSTAIAGNVMVALQGEANSIGRVPAANVESKPGIHRIDRPRDRDGRQYPVLGALHQARNV